MDAPIVVVGAGQAACQFVATLRQLGHAGPLLLIGDETALPYQRPPLSKGLLAGSADAASLQLRPAAFYDTARCDLRLGTRVERIERDGAAVVLAGGERIAYAALVLATGARARPLPGLPVDDTRIHCLRSVEQALALRASLAGGCRRLAIVGAGYVGMEVAASARQLGIEVTVLEAAPRVMQRSVGPAISEAVQAFHAAAGVDVRLGCVIDGIDARPDALSIGVDGRQLAVDALVVGVGALPNTELAAEAGIVCGRGIVVDERTLTSDPRVHAIGDCTEQTHALYGPGLRLESVANAIEQGRIAAAVLAGKPLPPPAVPWFWSDQYAHRLQVAGLPHGHDEIVLRRPAAATPGGSPLSVWYLRAGRVLAVEALDAPADFMAGRNLIKAAGVVAAAAIADASRPLPVPLPLPAARSAPAVPRAAS